MRLFKTIRGPWLVLVTGVALLAPCGAFAQPGPSQSSYTCTALNSYTQFCEYVVGQSSLSINPSDGQITVNAGTEVNWGLGINQNQCENYSDGNPSACQPPYIPPPSSWVQTEILPNDSWDTASGSFQAELSPAMTAQASQAGTYTEASYHSAYFATTGSNVGVETQASQSYTPATSVTSVSPPSPWQAGASTVSFPVTVTGTNFASGTTITMTNDSSVSWSQSSVIPPSTVTGTVTIQAGAANGSVTVAATAGGSGNNLLPGSGNAGGGGTVNVTINPYVTVEQNGAVIADGMDGGTCNANMEKACSGVVGQQIQLTGSPEGGTWSVGGTYYSQWNGQSSPGGAFAVGASSNPISFYWVTGYTTTYNVTYTVGSSSATATFDVAAPTSNLAVRTTIISTTLSPGWLTAGIAIYGESGGLTAAAVTPPPGYSAGSTTWLQTVNSTSVSVGGVPCSIQSNPAFPALDISYPYPNGNSTALSDNPGFYLQQLTQAGVTGTVQMSQGFTSTLLWQPDVSPSYPVPVAQVQWGWSGQAVWANGSWSASPGWAYSPSAPYAVATQAYPTWSSPLQRPTYNCKGVAVTGAN